MVHAATHAPAQLVSHQPVSLMPLGQILARQFCGKSYVTVRRQIRQLYASFVRKIDTVQNLSDTRTVDDLASCQCFQLIISIRNAIASHDGLNRLGQNLPATFQIVFQCAFDDFKLAYTASQRTYRNTQVAQHAAEVSQCCGVRQISLLP